MADLATSVGTVELATPVIAASGTFGYGVEYDGLLDWAKVGGISVKGLSHHEHRGHPAPRMVETSAGMLNAIGLQNVGVEHFISEKLPELARLGPRVIANCWGDTPEDYVKVVSRLDPVGEVDAIELNLSCPNKGDWGRCPAADPKATAEIVRTVRGVTGKPLWAKLSPDVAEIGDVARAAEEAGADAIVTINTLKAMAVDVATKKPLLTNVSGGMSGPAVKPVGLFRTYQAARSVSIPVVGAGGITTGEDAAEYLLAGASAVEVGTANLYDPAAMERIVKELDRLLDRHHEPSVKGWIGTIRSD